MHRVPISRATSGYACTVARAYLTAAVVLSSDFSSTCFSKRMRWMSCAHTAPHEHNIITRPTRQSFTTQPSVHQQGALFGTTQLMSINASVVARWRVGALVSLSCCIYDHVLGLFYRNFPAIRKDANRLRRHVGHNIALYSTTATGRKHVSPSHPLLSQPWWLTAYSDDSASAPTNVSTSTQSTRLPATAPFPQRPVLNRYTAQQDRIGSY